MFSAPVDDLDVTTPFGETLTLLGFAVAAVGVVFEEKIFGPDDDESVDPKEGVERLGLAETAPVGETVTLPIFVVAAVGAVFEEKIFGPDDDESVDPKEGVERLGLAETAPVGETVTLPVFVNVSAPCPSCGDSMKNNPRAKSKEAFFGDVF